MAVCGSNHNNPGSFVLDLGPHDGFGASFFAVHGICWIVKRIVFSI